MIRKPRHTVSNGQSLVDIAIQRYGTAEALFMLLEENPDLRMYDVLTPGQEVIYDPARQLDVPVARLFTERAYVVNCDQYTVLCDGISSDMWTVEWDVTWDGSKWVVNSALFLHSGIVADAVYSEDIQTYNEAGTLVMSSAPGNAPNQNPHVQFYTQNAAYGTVGVADFGFLPGKYTHTLRFDYVTLIDGTVCSKPFTLEFSSEWMALPSSVTQFDYVLPVVFAQ